MSVDGENQDLMALKKLLTSWHVGVLFDLFKEEDISIKELKMMDYNHIHSLLKEHKTGIRIRFEYNLKNWRQEIGMPLRTCEAIQRSICCCTNRGGSLENSITENPNTENNTAKSNACNYDVAKRRRSDMETGANKKEYMDENNTPLSPQSVYSNNSLINMLNADDVFNFGSITEPANDKTHNTDNEINIANVPLQALGELLSDSDNVPPKFPSKSTPEKYTVNLRKILKKSGSRAATILKFYQEKNRLTNVHRSQLIQLIVDYFIENEYHLSLNLSHNLEWEIIKMFPTENLEYYRTEKRGKIYAKFSNMKRYKRDRSLKCLAEAEILKTGTRYSQRQTNAEEAKNFMQENDDNWYPAAEPEIVVKEEADYENAS